MIVPYWPTQTWFSRLTAMLTRCPFLLPRGKQTLEWTGTVQGKEHSLPKMRLIVCQVSGDTSEARLFQEKLRRSYCLLGEDQQRNSIDLTSESGLSFVVEGVKIHFHRLWEWCQIFLTELFEKNVGYSTINTARSALSTCVFINGQSVGSHPLVVRFLKGVFISRPSFPRREMTWDTDLVLNYLRKLSPVKLLSLKLLNFKVVTLCAVLSGQREI